MKRGGAREREKKDKGKSARVTGTREGGRGNQRDEKQGRIGRTAGKEKDGEKEKTRGNRKCNSRGEQLTSIIGVRGTSLGFEARNYALEATKKKEEESEGRGKRNRASKTFQKALCGGKREGGKTQV